MSLGCFRSRWMDVARGNVSARCDRVGRVTGPIVGREGAWQGTGCYVGAEGTVGKDIMAGRDGRELS